MKRPSWSLLALGVSLAVFFALGVFMQARVFVFGEELMLHTSAVAARVSPAQPETGPLAFDPSCADDPPPRTLLSPDRRPTFSICTRGRRYPLIVASYIGGYLYWPFAALAPIHHDNALVLRRLAMVFGIADLVLTYLLVSRLRGRRFAAAAAVAIAVSPPFIITHSALIHFETLPWTFAAAAALLLLRCDALAPRASPGAGVPTATLWLAAFSLGLAAAANLKAVLIVVPAALVALRLGARLRPIRPVQWAGATVAAALPLGPAIWFAVSHPHMFLAGDKSGNMRDALRENLAHPGHWIQTIVDMLRFWGDFGAYIDPRGAAGTNWLAIALALSAFVVVVASGARTLWTRRGCPLTAACAAIVVAHVAMLALLVRGFPMNFTPLHTALGLCVALAGDRILHSRALGRLAPRLRPSARLALVTVALAVPFALSCLHTGTVLLDLPASFNLHAEKDLIALLAAVDPRDGAIHTVSTEDLMTGVVPSLSDGRIRVAEAQDYLAACRRNGSAPGTVAACFSARFRRLLEGLGPNRPLRFVLPADTEVLRSGERPESLTGGLTEGARQLGLRAVLERECTTASGLPAIFVYRVD